MNNTDILLIRACKSLKRERLYSVVRRFWFLRDQRLQDKVLRSQLSRICDDYDLISLSKFVSDIGQQQDMDAWLRSVAVDSTKNGNVSDCILRVLVSTIAYAPVKKFGPNYRYPRRFRDLEEAA